MRVLSQAEREFIERMPKAELHVHLEGSVYPETLLELSRKHGVVLPFEDEAGAREWFTFRDFAHFVEIYLTICSTLIGEEDFERITYEMASRAAVQNIRYLEITFAPASLINPRTPALPDLAFSGMQAGASRAARDLGVTMQFILDPVRTRTEEEVMLLARWCADNLGDGLIGFGLGGIEAGNPASRYRDAFDLASAAGARLSLHAGETAGPESVRDALATGAERIGHGVRSIEDPDLVTELVDMEIVIEVSPTSNICLGVAPTYAAHPLRELFDAGVQVTINSDDPPMFNTTLNNEYLVAAEHFDFTVDDLAEVSLRAIDAAFLPDGERRRLTAEFRQEIDRLRAELFPDE